MNKKEMVQDYFEWLFELVTKNRFSEQISYENLLLHLYNTEFTWIIPKDQNRASDGIDLRRRYADAKHISANYVIDILSSKPCSVLEMMVALAIRCEETIMDNPEMGDRTTQWFWAMVVSLGLGSMTNETYDEKEVSNIVTIFLQREYAPNGKGGLFTIKNTKKDLRDVEIWHQLCWYLDNMA